MSFESDFSTVLVAARGGEEWAWSVIYREYAPAVLRYLRGRGAREADDLLGEVFVQLVRNLRKFEGQAHEFRAWVFMIAHNRLIDERRRGGREQVEAVPDEVLLQAAGAGHAEDDAMGRLADQRVMAVLESLPTSAQRDVLFLRLFARLTVDEVAQVIGKRPGAVKALQSRAFAAIRRETSS